MDFSTALVTIKQPSGFWTSILNAFKNGVGTYVVAVILVAICVRLMLSVVDVFNKRSTMRNTEMMAKMKPELEAIQKKYGYDQRVLSQKQSELYKKYQFNMMGTFFPMLIALVLQLVVFLTLWKSLQAVSNYNIVNKYEDMKNIYANVLAINEKDAVKTQIDYENGNELSIEIDFETKELTIQNITKATEMEEHKATITYVANANSTIVEYINRYVVETIKQDGIEVANPEYVDTGYNEILLTLAQENVEKYYKENQEGFLWIKNVYKAESPQSPLFTKKEIKKYISSYYTKAERLEEKENGYEGKIYDYAIANSINEEKLGKNGYYILTLLAMLVSFLSIYISNLVMRNKNNPQKQSKLMYFIMPLIMGLFTFMYTSLFAIYIIVGQILMIGLTPLTTLIVKKWVAHSESKKKEKETIVVDYRRKDM